MFNDWEKFKVAVETSREPDFMLILENWKQLQFVPRDYFAKYDIRNINNNYPDVFVCLH